MVGVDLPTLWQRRRTLGAGELRVRRLHLDVGCWGDLCDVGLGESADPTLVALCARLFGEAEAGRLVCPIDISAVRQAAGTGRHAFRVKRKQA